MTTSSGTSEKYFEWFTSGDTYRMVTEPELFVENFDWLLARNRKSSFWPEIELKAGWQSVPYRTVDFPYAPGNLSILSKRASECLEPLLRDRCELLPLRHEKDEFYYVNVLDVVNCLDKKRAKREGRTIRKYAFTTAALGHHCFYVKDRPYGLPIVSETFLRMVREHGLTGFDPLYLATVNEDGSPHYDSKPMRESMYEGLSAHHIIPPHVAEARDAVLLLEKYQIDVNSSDNGMWLPTVLHENEMVLYNRFACAWMTRILEEAEEKALAAGKDFGEVRDALIEALTAIGASLLEGDEFPWLRGDS